MQMPSLLENVNWNTFYEVMNCSVLVVNQSLGIVFYGLVHAGFFSNSLSAMMDRTCCHALLSSFCQLWMFEINIRDLFSTTPKQKCIVQIKLRLKS
jgi:hypothetical protein